MTSRSTRTTSSWPLARAEVELPRRLREPLLCRVHRWPLGMPQYVIGHPDRLERIETALIAHPGLAVAGAAYHGVGIPDCIASGEAAAESVAACTRRGGRVRRDGVGAAVRRGDDSAPRRRELAGPRVPRRRRLAALHRARRGRVPRRRRRQPVRRLRPLVGPADPRPRAPASRRGARRSAAAGDELRRSQPARARARAADTRCDAEHRARPLRQLRHRGDDERPAARARVHRTVEDREVRRLLPRTRRPAARPGRLGRRDARPARLARRDAGRGRRHADRAVQRSRRGRRSLRRARGHRRRDRRAGRRKHGARPPATGVPGGPARADGRRGRSPRLRRGDDGLPRASWRRAGAVPGHAGPDDARQGHRRRPPGRRVRRAAGDHGARRAGGAGLPGRDALGEPARDDGRARDAAHADRGTGRLGRARARRERGSRRVSSTLGDGVQVARAGTMFGLFFSDVARHELGDGRARRHEPVRDVPPRGCSSAACTSRRRSSRPASSRRRTATPRSTRRSRPRATRSPS